MNAPVSHVVLGTKAMTEAEAFYAAILAMLGWRRRDEVEGKLIWRPANATRPLFVVMPPFDGRAPEPGNGAMTALTAPDRATVDAVHARAIALGAVSEGAPGLRPHYHANYYGAYFRDRDGNKLCIVCHVPVDSAPSATRPRRARLSRADMESDAAAWIAAWNRRDVEAVLAGFAANATFRSPMAATITGSAELKGAAAMRDYWTRALSGIRLLHFTLDSVVCDEAAQTMVVLYQANLDGNVRPACETFAYANGLKVRGEALYG